MSVGAYMSADLELLTDVMRERRKVPDGVPATIAKGRKDRAEAKVKKAVRAKCVERDVRCRLGVAFRRDAIDVESYLSPCDGPIEHAHMHVKRRSQTRNQAPEVRHTTKESLMLCKIHHDQYDGRAKPRLLITALSRKGADGPLKFTRKK